MRLRFVFVPSLIALATVAGCDRSSTKDAEKLQGTWIEVGDENEARLTTIQGDVITTGNPERQKDKATFKLNASRNPKEIDVTTESGRVRRGIYALESDTWKICFNNAGGDRPISFSGDGYRITVLMRQK